MKRTPIIRLLVAALVSVGLVLAPVISASAMAWQSAAVMDDGVQTTTSPTDQPCPCCDMAAKCAAAICTMTCVQLAPADQGFLTSLAGHVIFGGVIPVMHHGLNWRPPIPPPRV